MEEIGKKAKKQEIIQKTWDYLLEHGIENSSVGELCRVTGLSQSSLYHWFINKDDIWISAGRYGLAKEVECLIEFTFAHTDKIDWYFANLLDETDKYKKELRVALQITTSPKFGQRMREKSKDFRAVYEIYAEKIMEIFGCNYLQAEVFIYTIISCVIDYVIWDDKTKTQMLLDNLHGRINDVLKSIEENKGNKEKSGGMENEK